eukprot:s959_g5.t1
MNKFRTLRPFPDHLYLHTAECPPNRTDKPYGSMTCAMFYFWCSLAFLFPGGWALNLRAKGLAEEESWQNLSQLENASYAPAPHAHHYQFVATTTRYGTNPHTACGLDSGALVQGYLAVASAQAMQNGCCRCNRNGGGGATAAMGCGACGRGRIWTSASEPIFHKEYKFVVVDICPHSTNRMWCPKHAGQTNDFGVQNHFDFATVPSNFDNYYFEFTPEPCDHEMQSRLARMCALQAICQETSRKALGPRYIEFHPTLPIAYVVNELASDISIFEFDMAAAEEIIKGGKDDDGKQEAKPTLRLVQSVRTIPDAFPGEANTCGRVAVHSSGNFVLVSNRGHDSITVFRVHFTPGNKGLLSVAVTQHTRGATPRHFQFDASGQWLITANQDSDRISVFRFNLATGKLEFTGNEYEVPSPNFVCSVVPHQPLNPGPISSL